jgi:hypothetical protein
MIDRASAVAIFGSGVRFGAVADPQTERGDARSASRASLEITTLKESDPDCLIPDLLNGVAPCREQWSIKTTEYADGIRCVGYRSKPRSLSGGAGSAGESRERIRAALTEAERTESSLSRSRGLVIHRTRCLGGRYLWTFTKRGKFASIDDVWAAWHEFCRLFKWRTGKRLAYVAVPELHADGETWHLHAVLAQWLDVVTIRALWGRALGGVGNERGTETLGNVDARAFRGRGGVARRIATYVAKYVGKGFVRGSAHRRVFAASCGLNPIRVARWHSPAEFGSQGMAVAVGEWFYRHRGLGHASVWFNTGPLIEVFILQM